MDKIYKHQEHEEKIYSLWEKSGAFTPEIIRKKKPFTIIMPPPNANEDLHIGHARFVTVEDVLIRYHRMKGEPTLWLPGTDHAGIETQYVFEKKLAKEGKSRFDFDRDTLYKMIWDYSMSKKEATENQLRALGASCDWTRNIYTLDPKIIKIVYKTFKKLFDDGLIYRGERIVNYCPKCGTTFSQLEVNYVEQDDYLYYLNYGPIEIATTRPETIFADVAVAVNPKDKRYKSLIGKEAALPIINRKLPIVAHKLVDSGFGTGALKITPGHDATDFEIGLDRKLPIISVIDSNGKMINTPQKYIGLTADKARAMVIEDLRGLKKIKRIQTIHHTVGVCYKHKTPIEPIISKQWFIKVENLAKIAMQAIKKGEVSFTSGRYEKIAKHWLKNLKDWNISRQIVWGIRIPAWRCDKCLKWTITEGEAPKECSSCKHEVLIQDEDTFDTWFSSGQWPYATLLSSSRNSNFKLPISNKDKKRFKDFEYFYPTSVMETAYDILAFWVLRMLMLGLYTTGKVPFGKILLHGLVRDKEGEKISKSRGNVIDPLEMSEKYGADAVRMGIIWGTLVENDIALSEDNIRGQRNFSNKIWNIARFVFGNETKIQSPNPKIHKKPSSKNDDDKLILAELSKTTKNITKLLDKYRLNEASEEIYQFVWHKFADIYIEKTKDRKDEAQQILEYVLQQSLKLLHPFMPFVTEAIWSKGFAKNENDLLITSSWPS